MWRLAVTCVLSMVVGCGGDDVTDRDTSGEGGNAGAGGQDESGGAAGGDMPAVNNGGTADGGPPSQSTDAGSAMAVDAKTDAPSSKLDAAATLDARDAVSQLPPTNRKDIEAWIAKGYYKNWKCEATVMNARPNGAHGRNRVCSNDLASANTAAPYPLGAASIKELYDNNNKINGYAASVKVKAGAGANTWYWYEGGIEGVANPSCAGCHSLVTNYGGRDYVYIQVK